MSLLDISEVARRTGVPASTLRYYEEQGLIASVGRRGLKRLFEPVVIERLALISLGRAAGFSLQEIGEVVGRGPRTRIDKRRLAIKAEEIDKLIQRLTAMREGLRHAAACPEPDITQCKHFRLILRSAGAGLLPAAPRIAFEAVEV
ncbi:helix-turn-helix domain-containing protein [Phenylobacterium sp.]|jgi:DNA-binding transcriptional MerR regulator|uniref:helix-turn-helix domain-containing protein n=1 Tax=Phenylobacterium sp. TaxID=1871053 RepID=UPI002E36F7DC|nr:helix-turn-helix domain-containing protein [Phenylobacterium sp.]HEX2560779.1 helix-turn-helix domain-containing protein [Phenylobacterium sp.]